MLQMTKTHGHNKKYWFRSEEIKKNKNLKTSELSEGLFKIKILCISVDEKDTLSEIWK